MEEWTQKLIATALIVLTIFYLEVVSVLTKDLVTALVLNLVSYLFLIVFALIWTEWG